LVIPEKIYDQVAGEAQFGNKGRGGEGVISAKAAICLATIRWLKPTAMNLQEISTIIAVFMGITNNVSLAHCRPA
jgi:hypothetical protein